MSMKFIDSLLFRFLALSAYLGDEKASGEQYSGDAEKNANPLPAGGKVNCGHCDKRPSDKTDKKQHRTGIAVDQAVDGKPEAPEMETADGDARHKATKAI
jgi:hypothetical protein